MAYGKAVKGIVGGLCVIVVAAALVAPRFVDFDVYKPDILAAVTDVTGREASIDGSIRLRLFPRPTVTVSGVHIRNSAAGSDPDMATVEQVKIRLSLGSLLHGRLRADSVHLVRPHLLLETTPQGPNWRFEAATRRKADRDGVRVKGRVPRPSGTEAPLEQLRLAQPKSLERGVPSPKAVDQRKVLAAALDTLVITDGDVSVRHGGRTDRLKAISLTAEAQSLHGPFTVNGTLAYQQPADKTIPLSLALELGPFREKSEVPLSVHIGVRGTDAMMAYSGVLAAGRTVHGRLRVTARDGQDIARRLGVALPLPLGPVSFAGIVTASEDRIDLQGMTLEGGESHAEGTLSWDNTGQVSGHVTVASLDMDHWAAFFSQTSRFSQKSQVSQKSGGPDTASSALGKDRLAPEPENGAPETVTADMPAGVPETSARAETSRVEGGRGNEKVPRTFSVTVPTTLRGTIEVRVEALTWHRAMVRQGHVVLRFDEKGIAVEDVAFQLPGSASVFVKGRISPAAKNEGGAAFDMAVQGQSDDLRGLLQWGGIEVPSVPGNRLTRATVMASIGGTLRQPALREMEAVVDGTALRGAATFRPPLTAGHRFALGVTLEADQVNLDAYRSLATASPSGAAGMAEGDESVPSAADETGTHEKGGATVDSVADAGPAEGERRAWWRDIDATVHVSAAAVTANGVRMNGVDITGSLVQGIVTVTSARVDDIAGGHLTLGGTVMPSGGSFATPRLDGVHVALRSPNPRAMARALGYDILTHWPRKEALTVSLRASGTFEDTLSVFVQAEAAEGTVSFTGRVTQGLSRPQMRGQVTASAPDANRVGALFWSDVKTVPALGRLDLKGTLSSAAGTVALSDGVLTMGADQITGDVTVTLTSAHPRVVSHVRAGRLNVDRFRSWSTSAAWAGVRFAQDDTIVSDANKQPIKALAVHPRWSVAPWDLAALRRWNGRLEVSVKNLIVGGLSVRAVEATGTLEDGQLTVHPMTGRLYGGPVTVRASLDARQQSPSAVVAVKGQDIRAADLAAALGSDEALVSVLSGQGSMDVSLRASVRSQADAIQTLQGQGHFALKGMTLKGRGKSAFVLNPLMALTRVLPSESNNMVDVTGTFTAHKGRVQIEDMDVVSGLYTGRLRGVVTLPLWTVDADGTIHMSETLLADFLRQKLKMPAVVPLAVHGDIDHPTVRVLGSVSRRDGPKVQEVLPALLDKYLGKGQANVPLPGMPAVKPEKAARDFLKGLLFRQ